MVLWLHAPHTSEFAGPASAKRRGGRLCLGAAAMVAKMKGAPSPTKLIASTGGGSGGEANKSPTRRSPFHLDDPQYDPIRRFSKLKGYTELQSYELAKAAESEKANKVAKALANVKFTERQTGYAEVAKQESAYAKGIRGEELKQMKARTVATRDAVTVREKGIIEKTRAERRIMEARVEARQAKLDGHKLHQADEAELDHGRWAKEDDVKDAYEANELAKREAEAAEINATIKARLTAAEKAERDRDKRAKSELAAETKKAAEVAKKVADAREKAGKAQRMANMEYLNKQDRLHWEPAPSPVHVAAMAKAIREGKSPAK